MKETKLPSRGAAGSETGTGIEGVDAAARMAADSESGMPLKETKLSSCGAAAGRNQNSV